MKVKKKSHGSADAMDWEEAMSLIARLNDDGRYRDAMLISVGCNLGLRISDILQLRWSDLLDSNVLRVIEKKTGKTRTIKINTFLASQTRLAYRELEIPNPEMYIFCAWNTYGGEYPFSRIRAHQILKKVRTDYCIRSAQNFSTHSLRKTFGRRVWLVESEQGRGEQALYLLSEAFGHSNPMITKRYLGIRQDEILSLYDNLI